VCRLREEEWEERPNRKHTAAARKISLYYDHPGSWSQALYVEWSAANRDAEHVVRHAPFRSYLSVRSQALSRDGIAQSVRGRDLGHLPLSRAIVLVSIHCGGGSVAALETILGEAPSVG
jgi:hypothetical protein